ncbi:Sperm-associated antigen 1A [Zea mays]|uniref:Sperm-associated antigen 1A n=1 Tax=Zea mays TaxID=4577 RepID=A0A317YAE5_MAIZE|nr:Sperm-associated antigen 1A [Zea mays]
MSSYSGDRSSSSLRPTNTSFDSYKFDFGINSSRSSGSRPLRDQRPGAATNPPTRPTTGATWMHQPASAKPSWTHQPSPAAASAPTMAGPGSGPTSMVGDIFGRSWSSAAPSSGLGIPQANNPGLFSDLLGSALGSSRSQSNAPLRSAAAPQASRPAGEKPNVNASSSPFSMGGMAGALPKTTGAPMGSGGYGVGGRPMKPVGMAATQPMGQQRDPFGSIDPFAAKPGSMNAVKQANSVKPDQGFGAFQGVNSSVAAGFGSFQSTDAGSGGFQSAGTTTPSNFTPPPAPASMPTPVAAAVNSSMDPLDNLFASTTSAPTAAAASNGDSGGDMFGEMDGWVDVEAEFAGGDSGGTTTELDGLPPPPSGLTISAAKAKGMDSYKGGQYADAIKWLSWAVVLIEKSGKDADIVEVLSSRASSYKEVGEYKKAITDCSKVLDQDKDNVSVLVQRALLYESTEKYRLGAEDLRLVLKIDPTNRLARSTIHRLNKLAD